MHGSDKILSLLLQKHSNDLCVPECKVGSSWFTPKCPRFDLWVMKKSWTKPYTIGYEIKCNRSDFLRDDKWSAYLNYCTDFYFVAPPGVIHPEEVAPDVGLIVSTKNVARLYTKRKAVRREIQVPESIFRYILMWRTQIIRDQEIYGSRATFAKKYWQAWLKEKDECKELGDNVSQKIGQLVRQRINNQKVENRRLQDKIADLEHVNDVLKVLGLDRDTVRYRVEDKIRSRVREIETGIPEGLLKYLDSTINNLNQVRDKLTKL